MCIRPLAQGAREIKKLAGAPSQQKRSSRHFDFMLSILPLIGKLEVHALYGIKLKCVTKCVPKCPGYAA